MAQPWVTGPSHIYVGGSQGPGYLGCFEQGASGQFNPDYTPVMSDVAAAKPHDHIYGGTDAGCVGTLTVWNWTILLAIMSRPIAGRNFGYDPPGARGSLMVTEGLAYQMWMQFPYATKAAFGGFMPGGFRFPQSWLIGPDNFDVGTRPNKITIAFYMQAKQDSVGGWLLCDSNMTQIPAVPPAALS
jgi:hypothetical protein